MTVFLYKKSLMGPA